MFLDFQGSHQYVRGNDGHGREAAGCGFFPPADGLPSRLRRAALGLVTEGDDEDAADATEQSVAPGGEPRYYYTIFFPLNVKLRLGP